MAARAEEEENYWPGFVDALSTIVMVVTFLLVVMGLVVFAVSLQISKTKIKSDITGKPASEIMDKDTQVKDISKATTPEVVVEKIEQVESQSQQIKSEQSAGVQDGEMSEQAVQDETVEEENELQIQSRKIIEEKKIVVATQEATTKRTPKKVVVDSAQQILTLAFDKKAFEVNPEARKEIDDFMAENKETLIGRKLTAWAFYDAGTVAQSQAKRRAYFRVLSVRNVLIANGWSGSALEVNVRPAPSDEETDQVRVFVR